MKRSALCLIGNAKYNFMLKLNEGVLAKSRNKHLRNKNFTIISNNCWGGYIYRLFGLPYQSPTVGLFIMPDDYIRFVKHLKHYITECELRFIDPKESKHYDELLTHDMFGQYPIGVLGDIEICFMHYKTKEEAYEKWMRRSKRINWDNIIIKFNDQNGCTSNQIEEFNKIDGYKKMICFVAKKVPGRYNKYMWEFKRDGYVVDDKYYVFQHVNLRKLIDS